MSADRSSLVAALQTIAARLRIESVLATSEAGSGHPSSCCSAADIVATLFFAEMRFDPRNPQHDDNDRFVLSKGHAAPLLYAAWAEAGFLTRDELRSLRKLDCDLEGHPTPRLPFVDVATGSLGQGICAAIGIALNARRLGSDYRTYVLIGDGESAEGSVWEAAQAGEKFGLDNLCAVTDVNGYGQSRATQWGHDMEAYARRWRAFGWHALVVDGHDHGALLEALAEARRTAGRPTVILARTLKGRGVTLMEGRDGWHGKAIPGGAELERAVAELEGQLVPGAASPPIPPPPARRSAPPPPGPPLPEPGYALGAQVATREAYGTALAALGAADPRVVALDADVANSTFSGKFERAHGERFYETHIAEQVMAGAAAGLASRGAIPFPSTFACFLTRASDFIRMAGIGGRKANIKFAGSHAGVSNRRGRPVADGAGGLGDDAQRAGLRRAVPLRRRELRAPRGGCRRARRHGSTCARAVRRPRSSTRTRSASTSADRRSCTRAPTTWPPSSARASPCSRRARPMRNSGRRGSASA